MQTESYKFLLREHVIVFLDITDNQRLEHLAQALTECGGLRSSDRIFLFPQAVDMQEITQAIDALDADDCVAIAYAGDNSGNAILVTPQSQSSEGVQVVAE